MTNPLIDAPALAALLDSPTPPAVLDVRWRLVGEPGRVAYDKGHLPGAVFVDLDAELADPPGPGRHPLPDPERFAAAMRRAGVGSTCTVVVYDDRDATVAARAWWLLTHHGHPDVRVLDGGIAAWLAADLPVEVGEPTHATSPGDFVAAPGQLRVLDDDAAAAVAAHGVLLDARAAERYRAEAEPIDPVAGHVPGAVSAPTAGNVDADGRFHTADALRERLVALGVGGVGQVGVYCGSGVTASHTVLAAAIAGLPLPALYAGSWSSWITDPARPVATGPDPG